MKNGPDEQPWDRPFNIIHLISELRPQSNMPLSSLTEKHPQRVGLCCHYTVIFLERGDTTLSVSNRHSTHLTLTTN